MRDSLTRAIAITIALAGTGCAPIAAGVVLASRDPSSGAPVAPTPPPRMETITPTVGPQQGGTDVVLRGSNFTRGAVQAFVGGVALQGVTIVSDSELRGRTSPVAKPGVGDVVVANGAGTATLRSAFEFVAPPVITRVSPAEGPITGGVAIEIVGSGFVPGTVATVQSIALLAPTIIGETVISGTLPASALPVTTPFAFVDVAVSNSRGTAVLPQGFAYFGAPTIASVSPRVGPMFNFEVGLPDGSVLRPPATTIKGTGFIAGAEASFPHSFTAGFGFVPNPAPLDGQVLLNRSTLQADGCFPGTSFARTPGRGFVPVSGTVDLVVSHPLTGSGRLANAFTFLPQPNLLEAFPPFGAAGHAFRLLGSGYTSDARVFIGTGQLNFNQGFSPKLTGSLVGSAEAAVTSVSASELRVQTQAGFALPSGQRVNVVVVSPTAGATGSFGGLNGTILASTWSEYGLLRGGVHELAVVSAQEIWAATELGLFRTLDGGATWSRRHGDAGPSPLVNLNVTTVAVGPGGRVYAGTSFGANTVEPSRPNGAFRSDDGGATWQDANGDLPLVTPGPMVPREAARASLVDVAVDPADANVAIGAFAATDQTVDPANFVAGPFEINVGNSASRVGALWRTTDGGATWRQVGGVAGVATICLASRVFFAPGSSTVVYAIGIEKTSSPQGTGPQHLFRSADGGLTWTSLSTVAARAAAVSPLDPNRIAFVSQGNAVLLSTNGGTSFATRPTPNLTFPAPGAGLGTTGQAQAFDVAIEPTGALLLATNAGILRSVDGGVTWASLEAGVPEADRFTGFASFGGRGAGRDVLPTVVSSPAGIHASRHAPRSQVLASVDGGAGFAAIGSSFGANAVEVVAPRILGTSGGAVFRFRSGLGTTGPAGVYDARRDSFLQDDFPGADDGFTAPPSFEPKVPFPVYLDEQEVSAAAVGLGASGGSDQAFYYGLASGGVRVWEAQTTRPENNPRTANSGLPSPVPRVRALAASSASANVYAALEGTGVFRSTDRGRTWSAAPALPDAPVDLALQEDQLATDVLYAVTASGRLFRIDDAVSGTSWTELTSALGSTQARVVDRAADRKVFVGTGDQGVLTSADRGATWTRGSGFAGAALDVRALALHPDSRIAFAGTADGVYFSTDSGATWTTYNQGLPIRDVRVLGLLRLANASMGLDLTIELAVSGADGRVFVLQVQ